MTSSYNSTSDRASSSPLQNSSHNHLPDDEGSTKNPYLSVHMIPPALPESEAATIGYDASLKEIAKAELPQLVTLAWPLTMSFLVGSVPQLINLIFIGSLGTEYIASATLGVMYSNMTSISIIIGMSTALDTLLGHANGAKQYELVGIYVQRGILFLLVISIPCYILSFFTEPILLLFHQDPQVSYLAGKYVNWLCAGYFPFSVYIMLLKYLQVQGIVNFTLYSSVAGLVVNTVACFVLVEVFDSGYLGAAVAVTIQRWFSLFFTIGWILYYDLHSLTWPKAKGDERLFFGFHRESLSRWSQLFSLSVYSCLQVCLEWWAFEVLCIFAGIMGTPDLAAYTITINVLGTLYMIPLGLGEAVTIRCGNLLGANRPVSARGACYLSVLLALTVGSIDVLLLVVFRREISYAFTRDPVVVDFAIKMSFINIVAHTFDATVATFQGILKACGRQAVAAKYNLIMYYCIGIPMGLILGFPMGFGVCGLWAGLTCGIIGNFIVCLSFVRKIDWEGQAQEALSRLQEEEMARKDEESAIHHDEKSPLV